MANADELLRDAQYFFHSISFGDTRENRANKARVTSLTQKIIRKFPESMEASQARVILGKLQGKTQAPKFDHNHASGERGRVSTTAPSPVVTPVESPLWRDVEKDDSSQRETWDRERESRAHQQSNDSKLTWRTLWTGFAQLDKTKRLWVVAGVVFTVLFFGPVPFIFIATAFYFSDRLEQQYPAKFSRVRYELMRPIDIWLRKNKSK